MPVTFSLERWRSTSTSRQVVLARLVLGGAAMRTALISLVLLASACSSPDMCRSIGLGTRIDGMKRFEVTGASDPVFRAMLEPVSMAMYGRGSGLLWDQGPAEAAMCCSTQESGFTRSWCTAEQLECTDPSLQGVKLYVLLEPHGRAASNGKRS